MCGDLLCAALATESLERGDVEFGISDAGAPGHDEACGIRDLDGADVHERALRGAVVRSELGPDTRVDLAGPHKLSASTKSAACWIW